MRAAVVVVTEQRVRQILVNVSPPSIQNCTSFWHFLIHSFRYAPRYTLCLDVYTSNSYESRYGRMTYNSGLREY
jgi:hypothetical protein